MAEFRIGNVVTRSWYVLSRHFVTFFLLTGGALLPKLLVETGVLDFGHWFSLMCQILLGTFTDAVVIFAVFQELRGRRVSAGESISRSMSRFLPALLVGIFSTVLVLAGLLLLIVPGLIAAAAFAVAIPVCVVEREGTARSLSRSQHLTRGCRLRIMGVFAAYLTIQLAISGIIHVAFPESLAPVADWIWTVATTAYSAVYSAILYHDLRSVKEGIGINEIAAVFD